MRHTHPMIKDPVLRRALARELWHYHNARKHFNQPDDALLRYGMESGVWAVQKEYILAAA